jgi:hypothetical protein
VGVDLEKKKSFSGLMSEGLSRIFLCSHINSESVVVELGISVVVVVNGVASVVSRKILSHQLFEVSLAYTKRTCNPSIAGK